ncbi:MAG: hypothetical protein V9G10_07685 [Candidatus Nanopelagicales bacterium]
MFFTINWRWVRNVVAVMAMIRIDGQNAGVNGVRGLSRAEERPVQRDPEDGRLTRLLKQVRVLLPLEHPLGSVRGDTLQHTEQREEDRHLQQDRQAGRQGVGTGFPVQLHHLLRLALSVAGVLLLDFLDLRLDQLHVALSLDLLDEQRDQQNPDDDDETDDRQRPGPSARLSEDGAEQAVELDEDPRDGSAQPVQYEHGRTPGEQGVPSSVTAE